MKYLSDILEGLAFTELQGSADTEITAVVFDSRKVVPGALFVAIRGTHVDGHDYIDTAIKKGAAAIICEDLPAHTALLPNFSWSLIPQKRWVLYLLIFTIIHRPN